MQHAKPDRGVRRRMGPVLPCAFPLFVFAASAGAAKAAISDAERTPAQLAECYGRRYEDLNRRYCASPGVCDIDALHAHFERWGRSDGRQYGCDVTGLCAQGVLSQHTHNHTRACCAASCSKHCGRGCSEKLRGGMGQCCVTQIMKNDVRCVHAGDTGCVVDLSAPHESMMPLNQGAAAMLDEKSRASNTTKSASTVASCAHWPSGDEQWDAYRVGDVVHKGMGTSLHLWPSSIAAEYAQKWCELPNSDQHHMANITLLAEIVHGRLKATNDSEVIVHLRLGDVIERAAPSVGG